MRFRDDVPAPVERAFPLEDIRIRSGGDGRTVEAYASVFDTPYEVKDRDGHYYEVIKPTAFNRTLNDVSRLQVLFNHGRTINGTPSERYSMPLGTPVEVKADRRGLHTVTRYSRTPLADEVLQLISDGAIRGQSWSGDFKPGQSKRIPAARHGDLPTIERNEIRLREYGPTPFPASHDAAVIGVRAMLQGTLSDDQITLLEELEPDRLRQLIELVENGTQPGPASPSGEGTSDPAPPASNDTPTEPASSEQEEGTSASGPSPQFELELQKRKRRLAS